MSKKTWSGNINLLDQTAINYDQTANNSIVKHGHGQVVVDHVKILYIYLLFNVFIAWSSKYL